MNYRLLGFLMLSAITPIASAMQQSAELEKESNLLAAVRSNNEAKVKELLAQKINVNVIDPLIGITIKNGTDLNHLTPLMWAAALGYKNLALLLLNAGARGDLKNPQGLTASEIALSNGYPEIALLIDQRTDSSLRSKAIGSVADSVIAGKKTLAQLRNELPQELYQPVVQQVMIKAITTSGTMHEAIQKIKQQADDVINNDKHLAGILIMALAERFQGDFNMQAMKAMHPGLSVSEIEQQAKAAQFAPQSYITFATSQLDTPGAIAWLKEFLKGNTLDIAIIDKRMADVLNKIK